MEDRLERQVKGIWIPIEVWEDKELSWAEKLVLAEIDSYTGPKTDCFASNKHIADFLGLKEGTVANCVCKLKKLGYVVQTGFDGRKRYLRSTIHRGQKLVP